MFKTGDYVVCIESKDRTGMGWKLNKFFRVHEIYNEVAFPKGENGTYFEALRMATQEEINQKRFIQPSQIKDNYLLY